MLISNFNLYKSEWLDLVFDKRNKAYGAYNIRQHYAQNLTKALLISVSLAVGGALALGAAIKVEQPTERLIPVVLPPIPPPSAKAKEEEPPVKPELEKPKAAEPVKTRQFVQMVVTANPEVVDPPTTAELEKVAVGSQTTEGPENGPVNAPVETSTTAGKGGEDITETNEPVGTGVLSILPAPVGGDEAWMKFLKKNLRYPEQAIDAEKSGKVWISFIIEKDGSLTDIKVARGAGYGMDEEAMRVLKKAPAWTPGIQRGKPVRVQFTLPVNFSLGN